MLMAFLNFKKKVSSRESFEEVGYLSLPGFFSPGYIDATRAAFTKVLNERPYDVVVDSLNTGKRSFWANAEGSETRNFKFNDLYLVCPEVREMVLDKRLSRLLAELLGEPPVLCNSLNFEKGSGQPKHIDSLFMTPQTPHHLIATWTAFEDVHPDAGPLIYFPGSHKIPLFTFKDGTHHSTSAEMPAWNAYIESQLRERGLEEKVFHAKKGDVFIWHSDLVHGGGPIKDQNLTRTSVVCHYYSESDARRQKMTIANQNDGFWLKRLPQAVRVEPSSFPSKEQFPAESYLERYPDVKAAVVAGHISAFDHYVTCGYKEGRGI